MKLKVMEVVVQYLIDGGVGACVDGGVDEGQYW
jgi:hypothetical protein